MYPAYYYHWPAAHRRNPHVQAQRYIPHVHYASDVRPEGKYTTRQPFSQLNYSGTEQAQHDPSKPDTLHTPRHTRQMLPQRPALHHLAPPPVLPRRPVPLPSDTPAPSVYAYATPYVHERAPTASASQQASSRCPESVASNAQSAPLVNASPVAPPARPVYGTPPIWSWKRNRWEGDLTYEAQPLSVPNSSSPPAVAQSTNPSVAVPTTGPTPPVYQQSQSAQYQAPTSAQPDSRPTSSAPEAAAPLPSGVQASTHPPATSVEPSRGTVRAAEASDLHLQQAADDQPGHGGGSVLPETTSTGSNSQPNTGELVVSDRTSFKHRDGIYTLTILSPWETARSLKVTTPITVNDLHIILGRAPNLETAQFACIVSDAGTTRNWKAIHADNLKSLVINEVQTPIGGVLNDLTADELKSLHVSYSPGMAHHLWQDEQSYYSFLRTVNKHEPRGMTTIVSNDPWYRDNRAEHLRVTLESATTSDWTISVQ
ncbi:uncharacterized protein SCHCODRAFT_02745498 [Schizophyllum commune H4-8]|uniref:Uncharacterized protein n=1 Tax=Schizophyllum commune (strain H4-8 / FGSC 9210) TaxID=578458 RepID=D8PZV5_SCHCM|nr:uncharacterized protein SCHCODRAFT_02745498 [Schizophyllum commune H4-8]KAI5896531.1 hypothetical protein SCHCODRAFT_02745498 [Schizophyllum commune H4-8]